MIKVAQQSGYCETAILISAFQRPLQRPRLCSLLQRPRLGCRPLQRYLYGLSSAGLGQPESLLPDGHCNLRDSELPLHRPPVALALTPRALATRFRCCATAMKIIATQRPLKRSPMSLAFPSRVSAARRLGCSTAIIMAASQWPLNRSPMQSKRQSN